MKRFFMAIMLGLGVVSFASVACAQDHEFRGGDFRTGIEWKEPPIVTPGETPADPPSDAIVLFNGENLDEWTGGQWDVADGVITCKPGSGPMYTKKKFGSCQLHIEFACPPVDDPNAKGQARGNSGIFI